MVLPQHSHICNIGGKRMVLIQCKSGQVTKPISKLLAFFTEWKMVPHK